MADDRIITALDVSTMDDVAYYGIILQRRP